MNVRKTVFMGLFLSYALLLSYIEFLIPIPIGIPGIKLGLANLAVLLCLYQYGAEEAVCINVLRIILSGFLFGNLYTVFYSLAGGICSFIVMWLMKKFTSFRMLSISACGGMTHNVGQLLAAMAVVQTAAIFYYLPVLLLAGLLTGLLCGIVGETVFTYLRKEQK